MFLLHREPRMFFHHRLEHRKHPYARRLFQQSTLHSGLESQDLQDPGNPFLKDPILPGLSYHTG